ncbi:MAG TPA: phosphopentomutase [Clostridiaceae bacterium]|nr:phosphopentomutase [Clostridiaceae bacterium]
MKRVIIIVMDSVGIGELPDAGKYGDEGSNTLGNISRHVPGFKLPNLEMLGLGSIDGITGINKYPKAIGCYGRMIEKSAGKDTTTGHWEIAGIILDKPFPVYPDGFPDEIINKFEKAINRKVLGNVAASGTEIINELGQQHIMTGYPIVYTSADSVFQIAAHEEIIPVEELYEICRIAREILKGEHAVGRVIARPFAGSEGKFVRTDRRRDFSLKPIRKTVLDYASENGYKVKAVGKIKDIFGNQGITDSVHTHNNMDGVNKTIAYMKEEFEGIIFTNLVDFDMLYGHRNNAEEYARALMEFDSKVPELLNYLKRDDILIITADHGCDPTTASTDHSREYVPLLVYGEKLKKGVNLGTRQTFADVAATVAEYLELPYTGAGTGFYKDIML